ncbi:small hydrophobic protein [Hipposideros bat paramyxovirus]|nr:small hydrophobic protein [Hipposideros bat paramyxovirus]
MDSDSGSAIYMNTDFHREQSDRVHPNRSRGLLGTQITYLRDLLRLRRSIKDIYKLFLISIIANVVIVIVCIVLIILLLRSYYHSLQTDITREDQEIKDYLSKLYEDCKENPLNFNWVAQIFDRIEVAEEKIPDALQKIVIKELTDRIGNIIRLVIENIDEGANVFIKLDKAEGLEFGSKSFESRQGNKRRLTYFDRYHPDDTDFDRTRLRDDNWIGPTGRPG